MKLNIFIIALVAAFTVSVNANAKDAKKKAQTTAQADSLEIRKLTDAAKKGDAESQNVLATYYYTGTKVKQNYELAAKWYSMAAKQKHVQAIANLGLCYQYGHGVKADSLTATKLYKESISEGNAELVKNREEALKTKKSLFDINLLADIYYHGCGKTVKKDVNTAMKYYKMAADENNMQAIKTVADIYDKNNLYTEAAPYYKKAADKGDSFAAYKYGEYLTKGKGIAVDKTKAAIYLDKAAKKGIPNAMMLLGDIFYKGDGIQQDYSKALNLYKTAAVKGNPAAMWNIGIMYKNGLGVDQNFVIAMIWFSKAADNKMIGNFQKQLDDDNVEINNGWKGTPFYDFVKGMVNLEGSSKDVNTAQKTFAAMSKAGNASATAMLGKCYADNEWKKANEKKMLENYEKAAEQGDPYAHYLLAQFYAVGGKTQKANKEQVISHLEKAVEGEFAPAMSQLGDLYFSGKLVNKNITTAIQLYNNAILNGYISESAAKNLAACYEQGLGGLKKDSKMANDILKRGKANDAWSDMIKKVKVQ